MKHALWQAQNSQCKGVADIPDTYLGDDSYNVQMSGVDPGAVHAAFRRYMERFGIERETD